MGIGSMIMGGAYVDAGLDAPEDQGALDLLDRLRDLDAAGAGVGAVEGRAAAPDAFPLVEDLQSLLAAVVAAVEDEAVGVDDGGRAEVALVGPEDRTRRRAGGAQDALGGVVEPLSVRGRLQPLARRLATLRDEERL